jgi:hypothetical protein
MMSVNEMAMQKKSSISFSETWGGGGAVANWPTKAVGIATFLEFDESCRFLTPLVIHI